MDITQDLKETESEDRLLQIKIPGLRVKVQVASLSPSLKKALKETSEKNKIDITDLLLSERFKHRDVVGTYLWNEFNNGYKDLLQISGLLWDRLIFYDIKIFSSYDALLTWDEDLEEYVYKDDEYRVDRDLEDYLYTDEHECRIDKISKKKLSIKKPNLIRTHQFISCGKVFKNCIDFYTLKIDSAFDEKKLLFCIEDLGEISQNVEILSNIKYDGHRMIKRTEDYLKKESGILDVIYFN